MLKIARLVFVAFLLAALADCGALPSEPEALHMFLHGE